jgi:anti-sigma factor RsiW
MVQLSILRTPVILAYLDGELSRAAARKVNQHLQSCWNCRSAAAELELLAQTAYTLLAGRHEADAARAGTAKGEFLRRKAKINTAWNDGSGHRISLLADEHLCSIRAESLRKAYSSLGI